MPTFHSDAELKAAAIPCMKKALDDMLDAVLDENEVRIRSNVYDVYTPIEYDRTDEFEYAWSKTSESSTDSVNGETYFDPSKLTPNPFALQHTDMYGQSQVTEMADFIYVSGQGAFPRPTKRNAWKKLDRWFSENKIRQLYHRGLKNAGLPVIKSSGDITKQSVDE